MRATVQPNEHDTQCHFGRAGKSAAAHQGSLRRGVVFGDSKFPENPEAVSQRTVVDTFPHRAGLLWGGAGGAAAELVARLFTAVFGLAFFVLSILLPPAELESATDRKARELGAKTVVSGGEYEPQNGASTAVQLFISPSHVWALDKYYDAQVGINISEITSVDVVPRAEHWLLVVRWGEQKTEFVYKGIFAERFARLAEESVRHASVAAQPLASKSRAARV